MNDRDMMRYEGGERESEREREIEMGITHIVRIEKDVFCSPNYSIPLHSIPGGWRVCGT